MDKTISAHPDVFYPQDEPLPHFVIAAATAPVSWNATFEVVTTWTGYFHSMILAQAIIHHSSAPIHSPSGQEKNSKLPQKAHLLPSHFPMNGTSTILSSSSSCCNDSCHSASASESCSSLESISDAEASDSDCCEGGGRSSSDGVESSDMVELD